MNSAFGDKLRSKRIAAGFKTQADLSCAFEKHKLCPPKLKISRQIVSAWERLDERALRCLEAVLCIRGGELSSENKRWLYDLLIEDSIRMLEASKSQQLYCELAFGDGASQALSTDILLTIYEFLVSHRNHTMVVFSKGSPLRFFATLVLMRERFGDVDGKQIRGEVEVMRSVAATGNATDMDVAYPSDETWKWFCSRVKLYQSNNDIRFGSLLTSPASYFSLVPDANKRELCSYGFIEIEVATRLKNPYPIMEHFESLQDPESEAFIKQANSLSQKDFDDICRVCGFNFPIEDRNSVT